MSSDIQATHQILSLLEKSKSFSDRMLDQISGALCIIDSTGTILRGNNELAQLFGTHNELLLGRPLSKIFDADDWDFFFKKKNAIELGEATKLEFELPITLKGKKTQFYWSLSPVTVEDAGGHSDIILCMGRDISELLEAHSKVIGLQHDLEVVEIVQKLFLPQQDDFKVDGISVSSFFRPAEISSGDYWWFEKTSEGKYSIILVDVTGHGVGPAMVTGLTAGIIRSFFQMKTDLPELSGEQLLGQIHEVLCSLPDSKYGMTATLLEIDTLANKLSWTGASPPLFFIYNEVGELNPIFVSGSSPLGIGSLNVKSSSVEFLPGSRVVVATDGIFELVNGKGTQLGDRRVAKFLSKIESNIPVEALRDQFHDFVEIWRGDVPPGDDLSAVVIER